MQPTSQQMPSRRRPIIVAAVLGILVLLVAGAAIAYFAGVFDAKGRFTAAPPVCDTLDPGLHLLGTGYTTRKGSGNTCDVLLPSSPTPMMTVSYLVGSSPGKVSSELRERGAGQFREISGLGDEGYTNGGLTVFRVSNLMVGIAVFPNTGTTDAQIRVFSSDLASRLAQ